MELSAKLHHFWFLSLLRRERIKVRVVKPRLTLTPTLSLKGEGESGGRAVPFFNSCKYGHRDDSHGEANLSDGLPIWMWAPVDEPVTLLRNATNGMPALRR